ncbi:MAG: deaminase [Clostridiales bacterium]|nr:deaminase [Clostridiales bacterium]
MSPEEKMAYVLGLAREAMDKGELPIAAAVYLEDERITSAYTTERADKRWLIHAELKALLEADSKQLPYPTRAKLELYTNLEPCLMCLGAAMSSFVGKVYYALEAPEDGAVELVRGEFEKRKVSGLPVYHFPEVTGGVLREQSIGLFREFVERNQGKPGLDFAKSLAAL